MPNEQKDKTIKCLECGESFAMTVAEQGFFVEKGFNEPKRCRPCRQKRKAMRAADERYN